MAVSNAKTLRRVAKEKERISKYAFYILVAFCVQFLIYLVFLNLIPFYNDADNDGRILKEEVSSFYKQEWNVYQVETVNSTTGQVVTQMQKEEKIDNGMEFIHGYNMVLLVATIILCIYYGLIFMEEYEGKVMETIKKFFKENKGLLILLCFMTWVFISSLFAFDKFRSFVGCHNLRDGYLSFMFYASVLVCILLLGKDKDKYAKKIVKLFLITTTIIASLTLFNYFDIINNPSETSTIVRDSIFDVKVYGADKDTIVGGPFNNSNHYGYLLSISVVVAAVMFVKEKNNLIIKALYGLSFLVMTYMLILNNTFGAYLGVGIAISLMLISEIITYILKAKKGEKSFDAVIAVVIVLALFVGSSFVTKNYNGEVIAKNNFADVSNGVKSIVASLKNDESEIIEGEVIENTENNAQANTNTEEKNIDEIAGDAGSGRWKLWVGALEIIKKFPVFGCGLENMIYEYAKIDINEGRSHNLVLQLAGTTGIPGALLYIVGVLWIFFKGLRNYSNLDTYSYMGMFVMISYLISSLTGNSGFYTSGYFYIFVGLLVLGTFAKKEELNKK